MKTRNHAIRSRSLRGVALALGLLTLATGASAERDGCRKWFPDFDRACEREFRFPGFVAPMTMPYLFEDPFITTGAQFVGIWHDFSNPGALEGGEAGILALQLRAAITDRLAFIATKDGLVIYRPQTTLLDAGLAPSTAPLLKDAEGFTDITLGFKYALIKKPEDDFILTPALRYEIPVGQRKVLQNQGDGVFIPSVSFAWGLRRFGLEKLHIIGNLGYQVGIDQDLDSDSLFYNLHVDYALFDKVVPFMSVNGMTWTRGGDGSSRIYTTVGGVPVRTAQNLLATGRFEGADYGNLGSPGMSGKTLFTMAWGLRFPLTRNISLGAVYEIPLTGSRHVFKQRVTTMASYEF